MSATYVLSSKTNPCPLCTTSDQHGDCRSAEGGTLIYCHRQRSGSKGELVNGFRFLYEQDRGAGWGVWTRDEGTYKASRKLKPERQTFFNYNGRDGKSLLRVHRQKGAPHEFWQSYFTADGEWRTASKVEQEERDRLKAKVPIYAYRQIQEAIAKNELIFWVEGETTAKALWQLGIAATTSIGGCKAFSEWGDYSEDLKGAQLVICPDRDTVGLKYAEEVEAYFSKHDATIVGWCYAYNESPLWREDLLPTKSGLDLDDWLKEGIGKEVILGVIEPKRVPAESTLSDLEQAAAKIRMEVAAYLCEPDKARQVVMRKRACMQNGVSLPEFNEIRDSFLIKESEQTGKPRMRSPLEVMNAESEGLEFLIDGWLPRRDNAILVGESGCGKTLFAVDQGYSLITGTPWMGEATKKAKVLFIVSDQRTPITRSYLIDRGFRADDDNWRLVGEGIDDDAKWTVKHLDLLEQWLDEYQPDVVYIDSVISTIIDPLGLKLESTEIGAWMERVQSLVNRYGSCIWMHHSAKSAELTGVNKASGSFSITAKPSFVWNLERISKDPTDPNRRLSVQKCRRIEPQTIEIKFDQEDSSFCFVKRAGEALETTKRNQALQYRILEVMGKYPADHWIDSRHIKEQVGSDSVYTFLSRMTNRGLISMRPQSEPGKRGKVYQLVPAKIAESAAIALDVMPQQQLLEAAIAPEEEYVYEEEPVIDLMPEQPEPVQPIVTAIVPEVLPPAPVAQQAVMKPAAVPAVAVQPELKRDAKPICREPLGAVSQASVMISGGHLVKPGDRVRCRKVEDMSHGVHGLMIMEIRENGVKLQFINGHFKPEELEVWQG